MQICPAVDHADGQSFTIDCDLFLSPFWLCPDNSTGKQWALESTMQLSSTWCMLIRSLCDALRLQLVVLNFAFVLHCWEHLCGCQEI